MSEQLGVDMENKKSRFEIDVMGRAENASQKVRDRINSDFLPRLQRSEQEAKRWVDDVNNDIYGMIKHPLDKTTKAISKFYEGWTKDELKEYYFCLYGEEIED